MLGGIIAITPSFDLNGVISIDSTPGAYFISAFLFPFLNYFETALFVLLFIVIVATSNKSDVIGGLALLDLIIMSAAFVVKAYFVNFGQLYAVLNRVFLAAYGSALYLLGKELKKNDQFKIGCILLVLGAIIGIAITLYNPITVVAFNQYLILSTIVLAITDLIMGLGFLVIGIPKVSKMLTSFAHSWIS